MQKSEFRITNLVEIYEYPQYSFLVSYERKGVKVREKSLKVIFFKTW